MSDTETAVAPTVIHLGNPVPHKPITSGGTTIGHEAIPDAEPTVTELHLSDEAVTALVEGKDEIVKAIETEGLVNYTLRTVNGLLQGAHQAEHDMFAGHVLHVISSHARAGISWLSSGHNELEHVLSCIFDAEKAPQGTSEAMLLARHEHGTWDEITDKLHAKGDPTALKTKKGVEALANSGFGTSAQPAQMKYFALTANAEAAASTDTTLAGEITTASGGLIRKEATSWSFTESTGIGIIGCTFTANASDALEVKVEKFGIFNKATSGGTLGIETKLSSSVALKVEGDNLTITDTLTFT